MDDRIGRLVANIGDDRTASDAVDDLMTAG